MSANERSKTVTAVLEVVYMTPLINEQEVMNCKARSLQEECWISIFPHGSYVTM